MLLNPVTEKEVQTRLELFEKECRQRGLRVTPQRREIFKAVAFSREHPSAEAVFSSVRKKMANVSLDTVYRTLSSLEHMGLLWRVGVAEKERYDGNLRPHAHFICTSCGNVYDVFAPSGSAPLSLSPEYGQIKSVNVQFRGICKQCVRLSRKNLKVI